MSEVLAASTLNLLVDYAPAFWSGIVVSLKFLLWTIAVGFPAGLVFAVIQVAGPPIVRVPIIGVVEVIRNTPLLVQLWWIHFAIPMALSRPSSPEMSAAIGLGLSGACYFSEVIRGGFESLPRGQREAASALGIGRWCLWTRILIPQAIIDTLPASANTVLSFFKATSILSVIAVPELMATAMRINSRTAEPITLLTTMGLIYVALGLVISSLLHVVERGFASRSRR